MYTKYLKYVLRHKYYVLMECFKVGLYWRGIMHDMSKFLPSEFIPYARYFYGEYPEYVMLLGTWGRVKTKADIKRDFDIAWLKHIHRNKHHWQYWLLRKDDGGSATMFMPDNYTREMVCDWHGAGMAINGKKDTIDWYEKNKDKMNLHPATRSNVEHLI